MLKNFKIYSKLFINTLQIVGMFIIVMVIYTKTNSYVTKGFTELIDHEMKILEEAENCKIYIHQMKQHEKEFIIRKDLDLIKKHKKSFDKFMTSLIFIESKCIEERMGNIKELAVDIKSKVDDYKNEFQNLVSSCTKIGLDHKSGLQGAFRDKVHDLETELKKDKSNDKLITLMLTVRRKEKDYLLRYENPADAKKYIQETQKAVADLNDAVNNSTMNSEQKGRLDALMTAYLTGFNNLTQENAKITSITADINKTSESVIPLLEGNKENKLLGVVGEIKSIVENDKVDLKSKTETEQNKAIIFAIFTILVSLVFSKLITNSITKPLKEVVEAADRLAKGDLTKNLNLNRKDEIGQLSNSLNQAIANLRENINFLIHNSTDIKNASNSLHDASEELNIGIEVIKGQSKNVKNISTDVATNMDSVNKETSDIAGISANVKVNTDSVNNEMTTVASSVEQSQCNVQSIAAASEQMSATINEIAENTERCRNITKNAVSATESASKKVSDLSLASSQIEKIILVIEEISEQTKNLALNATIEAARAGEAGKGFAVVANEVKELARQTSEATVEVRDSIMKMAMHSDETVGEIGTIQGVINEVNEIVNTIAAAIEEQSISVQDNSKNTTQAAQGLMEVTKSVSHVSQRLSDITTKIDSVSDSVQGISSKCTDTSKGTSEVLKNIEEIDNSIAVNDKSAKVVKESSHRLSLMSDKLDELISKFKVDDKDLTHYSLNNLNGSGHTQINDQESKNEKKKNDSIIAAMQPSV